MRSDAELMDNIHRKVQLKCDRQRKIRLVIRNSATVAACLVIAVAGIFTIPKLFSAGSSVGGMYSGATASSPSPSLASGNAAGASSQPSSAPATSGPVTGGGAMYGVAMFNEYRYDGNYYCLNESTIDAQSIEKCLYDSFYQIKGVDPSVRIAIFVNNGYWPLDYLFSDSVTYNGKPYLMELSTFSSRGSSFEADMSDVLGQSGGFTLYAVKGCDSAEEIGVQYGDMVHPAFQVLSSVNFNGAVYDVDPMSVGDGSIDSNYKYLGKAGPYDAYQPVDATSMDSITLKISDTQVAHADARNIPPAGTTLPQIYMGPAGIMCEIQYRGHGIYAAADTSIDAQQAGALLDSDSGQGITIYAMNGVDPSQSVIVKYDGYSDFYEQYDYMFPDTIIYNGATYQANYDYLSGTVDGTEITKGGTIGMAGAYQVFEIQQVDPSVVIDVYMSGSSPNIGVSGDTTYYRVQ